jgi:hypothetical protein
MLGNSSIAAKLEASQEKLSSMKLNSLVICTANGGCTM